MLTLLLPPILPLTLQELPSISSKSETHGVLMAILAHGVIHHLSGALLTGRPLAFPMLTMPTMEISSYKTLTSPIFSLSLKSVNTTLTTKFSGLRTLVMTDYNTPTTWLSVQPELWTLMFKPMLQECTHMHAPLEPQLLHSQYGKMESKSVPPTLQLLISPSTLEPIKSR